MAMPQKCAHCTAVIPDGTEYIEYGGLCWCETDCLAQYYVEHEDRFKRAGKGPDYIEQAIHHKVVFNHDATTGPPGDSR